MRACLRGTATGHRGRDRWGESGARVRLGRYEVRPLGGGLGCLGMLVFSVVASIILTVLVNLIAR